MSNITVNSQFIRANFMQAIKDGHVHAFFQPIMMNISYSRENVLPEKMPGS